MRSAMFACCAMVACSTALANLVPNPSFEEGVDGPAGWSLDHAPGAWSREEAHSGIRSVAVTGNGTDTNFWRCNDLRLTPGALYAISFWVKASADASGGSAISCSNVVNRDFPVGPEWAEHSFVFRAPDVTTSAFLRFGHWRVRGTLYFDDIALRRVTVAESDAELGDDETVQGKQYAFNPAYGGPHSNYHRPLVRATAGFNTNRWPFFTGAELVYRHRVPGARQTAATISVNIGYYQAGACGVSVSTDGRQWQQLGVIEGLGTRSFEVPDTLLPAEAVMVRLVGQHALKDDEPSHPGGFQVYNYAYTAQLDRARPPSVGRTVTFAVEQSAPDLEVRIERVGALRPAGRQTIRVRLRNKAARKRVLLVAAVLNNADSSATSNPVTVAANQSATVEAPYAVTNTGRQSLRITVRENGQQRYAAVTRFNVAALYAADYGFRVAGASPQDADVDWWWCQGPRKVSVDRPVPAAARPVTVSAARNEYEPVQVILRPRRRLEGVTARAGDFVHAGGARIPARNVTVWHVHYHRVKTPTDSSSVADWWPDALPPADEPFVAPAGRNTPLWVTVHVPEDAAAGEYRGAVIVTSGGRSYRLPVNLRVFDFALPDETQLQSGFGLSAGLIRRYHNLETEDELRQVMDLYYDDFRRHRICPYDPMGMDPIGVNVHGREWSGGRYDSAVAHSGTKSLQVADDNDRGSIVAAPQTLIPIRPDGRYQLSWWAKAAKPGPHMVSLNCYDEARQWISGANHNFTRDNDGQWTRYTADIRGGFHPRARYVRVHLRPAPWTERGEKTGTAWFDDVEFREAGEGGKVLYNAGFETTGDTLRVDLDFTAFDRAAHRYLDEFGFNSFRLRLQGLGGGTFYARNPGSIGGYQVGEPEYETLMGQYLRGVEAHLREKGWLKRAYIYWFDEPAPKDYAFVRDVMDRIKRLAPGLTTFLTEQPEPELGSNIDIWCPVLHAYNETTCPAEQRKGKRIWWYVCTGPKAPYCGLFIDHPGIEMRMWLWQTWKYHVQGVLVWQTNYWTSSAAFPAPRLQNPWEDPMGYVSGYGRPPGTIAYWGNGDGRFLYPPNRDPERDRSKHLTGPIDSIRWEALRDGVEDFEYFHLLRQRIAGARRNGRDVRRYEALLTVPEEICQDRTHFARDPRLLLAHRDRVARAIEALGR